MNSDNLIEFVVGADFSLAFLIDGSIAVGILVVVIFTLIWRVSSFLRIDSFEVDEAEIGIGKQKIRLKPNQIDSQIAYKIWVELSTRKIGIPVDKEKDVISEVYDSWYTFFAITRELIKEIPASKLKRKETRRIIKLSVDVLNLGVRPHLTNWQATFRRWNTLELAKTENSNKTPQEIQREYPKYDELISDLLSVNQKLISYKKMMYRLAKGVKTN